MQLALLVPEYIVWHYTGAVRLTANIISNFVWFGYHFFSVPILTKTLFEPLSGVGKELAAPSRFFGFIIRAGSIFFAYLVITIIILIGIGLMMLWLILPFIAIALIFHGLRFLMS